MVLRKMILAAVTTGVVTAATLAASVPAQGATASGSIVYSYKNNIWLMNPDGTGKVQVTKDGTAASPYYSPSESDNGNIVAVRDDSNSLGHLYVFNRAGQLFRSFTPPQYAETKGNPGCATPVIYSPDGLIRAIISPDGKQIAYTPTAYFQTPDCEVSKAYSSLVIPVTGGSTATQFERSDGNAVDLELGGWAGNGTVLLSDMSFGSTAIYRASVSTGTATTWQAVGADSYDAAYEDPSYGGTVLGTTGFSESASANVVRLWTASSVTAKPTARCEITATSGGGTPGDPFDATYSWPVDIAPDGTGATWVEYSGDQDTISGLLDKSDEGIYATTFSSLSSSLSSCPASKKLIAAGGWEPYWGKAAVATAPLPVPKDTVAPKPALAAPATAILSSSVKLSWSATDTGTPTSGVLNYDVRYRKASYTGNFGAWTTWKSATTARSASFGLTAGYSYCFQVRARDKAGNVSGWTAARCTTRALDDRKLAVSAHWTRATDKAAYAGTVTKASYSGASLSLAKARVSTIGLVVTQTSTGGSATVAVGSTKIGTVSFKATKTVHQKVVWLPAVTARTGTIKITTANKNTVQVDGLVSYRTS